MRAEALRRSNSSDGAPNRSSVGPPTGVARLLSGVGADDGTRTLEAHLDRWGRLPEWRGATFIDELETSGLRGHGGAWFPVGVKWRDIRGSRLRAPVVVANGAAGEPASGKDRLLIEHVPHLVLDGAVVAARALGASRVVVHVPARSVRTVTRAIESRQQHALDPVGFDVVVAPDRFLAGQESAVVSTVNGRNPGIPTFTGLRTIRERGVDGRPTLVQNVETLAHVALIARFGAGWFRSIGTHDSPGTALVTVTGRWSEPRVIEAPLGVTLGQILGVEPGEARSVQGVLFGGYGGGWVATADALAMPFTEEAARLHGTSIGAGVVALLPTGTCPLSEVSRVVTYLEGQGAGQCGPCVNGLALLATAMDQLAFRPRSLHGGLSAIPTLCGLVEGRGACRHPDGVARFTRSALQVFRDHANSHIQRGICQSSAPPFLPLPPGRRSRLTTPRAR
jgi:NADH:ubiquinone oxidoreductase subunit F (NADH-binding)